MNDPEQQGFLDALARDEKDEATRLVYADWLEERGDYEEAHRQRRWMQSRHWLEDLAEDYIWDVEAGRSYDVLMRITDEAAQPTVGGDRMYVFLGRHQFLGDAIQEDPATFWMHWSIVTGRVVPPGSWEDADYGCSC